MSSKRINSDAPGGTRVLSMSLLAIGLYGMVLGEAIQLALRLWPGTLQNDLSFSILLLALSFVIIASLLILASLLSLRTHWLLVIGVFLLSLLAAFVQGRLFPADVSYWITYWFLTYGSVVVVLSLILLGLVKGVWPALWRVLLVTAAGAAIAIAVLVARGPDDWIYPRNGADVLLVNLLVGVVLILILKYWLIRTGREPSLKD